MSEKTVQEETGGVIAAGGAAPDVRRHTEPPDDAPKGGTRVAAVALVLVLVAASIWARFGLVNRHALWADELFSLAMATGHSLEHAPHLADPAAGDFIELRQAASPAAYSRHLDHDDPPAAPRRVVRAVFLSDTSPPLYYLLLYAWTRHFGTTDAAVRHFSIVWGLACLPVVWSLGRQIGGKGAAWPALLLFALSPLAVYYSTEARMYSLLWFCTVCTMWLTLALRRRGPRADLVAGWVLASAAGFWTHYFFLFAWAAAGAWLLFYPGRFSRRWLLGSTAAIVLLVLPWYVRIPQSLSNWRVTGNWLNMRPRGYHALATPLKLPWTLFSLDGPWGGVRRVFEWVFMGLFVVLAVWAAWSLGRRLFSVRRRLAWLWLVGPCAGIVLFDLLRGTYVAMNPRYALAALPAGVLLLAFAVSRMTRPARVAVLALMMIACANGVRRMYRADSRNGQPYDKLAAFVVREAGPSDVVIVHSIPSGVAGVSRYVQQNTPRRKIIVLAPWVGQFGRRRVPDDIVALAQGRRRVILVKIHDVGEPALQENWLREHGRVALEEKPNDWSSATVFEPREGEAFETDAGSAAAPAASTEGL